jgi:hypothetical protein
MKHMLRSVVRRDPASGAISADWQSPSDQSTAPFDTYSNNVIESFWNVHGNAANKQPKHLDILVAVQDLEDSDISNASRAI